MKIRLFAASVTVLMSVGIGAVTASPASAASTSGIRIIAIYFDSPGADNGSNSSLNAEYVRIENITSTTKTLTGWALRDATGHLYTFPAFALGAHRNAYIHTGSGTRGTYNLYWNAGYYIWNNSGDKAGLRNAVNGLVDTCSYTAAQDPRASC